MKLVLLDLDGVIVDFVSAALAVHDSPLSHDDVSQWDMAALMGIHEDELWRPIDVEGPHFWQRLDKYPWADEVIRACRKAAPEFCIATTPSRSPHSTAGKIAWLQGEFGEKFRDYALTPRKHHMARPDTLLVDDSNDNCAKFVDNGGRAILFPQPWNQNRQFVPDRMEWFLRMLEREIDG